jgi:hypothetical protein
LYYNFAIFAAFNFTKTIMLNYKQANNITGWIVFVIATAVYVMTIEPTASFWDVGEFIAASYKLQVPHPPGAPLFLLIGRMFSLIAGDDVTRVAYWVNMVSALSSSFTILFLFWTITMLARKLVVRHDEEPTQGQTFAVLGSGIVGALAYTFSDSFWFSAVEAEVYAMSSLFTAAVFWAILKWERVADKPDSDRWLILIAYLMGLSIGVHLLNLVSIPALAMVYYFKRNTVVTNLGVLVTFLISGLILGVILSGIIPGLPSMAASFEIFFVNNLGLPFGSGIIFFMVLFLGALVWGILYSVRKRKHILNTALLSLAFILIGYASYGIIVIRSNYNPPIDENNPENIISFVSYLKREQYGDRPLLYGPQYTAKLIRQDQGSPLYRKAEDKYVVYDYKTVNIWDDNHKTLLPRIYSTQPNHIEAYKTWVNLPPAGVKPSMGQNLSYMFRYQIGWMYWRYFMWNFAGRASDIQDAGWLMPWDSSADLPETLANNKGRNNFFLLPLILGIAGLFFQLKRNGKDAAVVGLLFFFTGIAIVIYLNQPPVEPRERDYTFAGSFYAFAIWIGLGVMALSDALSKLIKSNTVRPALATLVCLLVPGIMAAEGWDDHDRSDRYHSVDSAKNLLNSCAPNAIIFTGGDNDTFPLWYVQEVEGFRTDVRVCNLSLLNTDWYIEQMKRQQYESAPLPISLEQPQFIQGKNDYLPFVENPRVRAGLNLSQYLDLIRQDHPAIQVQANSGSMLSTLPSKTLYLPVDRQHVINLGIVPSEKESLIQENMVWDIGRNALEKKDLIILDMLVTNNWERPIYFSTTLSPANYLNLREWMQMEGLAYRLLPAKVPGATQGVVQSDIMFENLMNNFHYRELDNPNVYYDENYKRFTLSLRNSFYRLAGQLINEGSDSLAKQAVDFAFERMPDASIPYDVYTPQFISVLVQLGDTQRALEISETMATRAQQELDYYLARTNARNTMDIQQNLYILNQIVVSLRESGLNEESAKYDRIFRRYTENPALLRRGGL